MAEANPRAACVEALMRWEKGTEFADTILHRAMEQNRFTTLDRALFMEIFYGVIRLPADARFSDRQAARGRTGLADTAGAADGALSIAPDSHPAACGGE